jgi:NAD+ synthase (glutamine-hydrolysing)
MSGKGKNLRLGLAQINVTVGDFPGNYAKIVDSLEKARNAGVDIITFPELAICGYPPEDLLMKPQFIEINRQYLQKIFSNSCGLTIIIGFVDCLDKKLFNAAAIISGGCLQGVYRKILLPNYGVFDEKRYFNKGHECPVFEMDGIKFGVTICEDIWYECGPATAEAYAGAELVLNISASPYHYRKASEREDMLVRRASIDSVFIGYNNLVGGQDELVFDGNSLIIEPGGHVSAYGRSFDEDLVVADLDLGLASEARNRKTSWQQDKDCIDKKGWPSPVLALPPKHSEMNKAELVHVQPAAMNLEAEIYSALLLGTHDYFAKNGFSKAVIGLSGGIDSALVAVIAVDALGSQNVVGVSMPSRFSSHGSIEDSVTLSQNLGIRLVTLPIETVFSAYLTVLKAAFDNLPWDITEENIQARIRGNYLMALSNKFGWLVLPTGNKSEMAAGYATLYGDMAGGFAILKDVPKTMVYRLVAYRNGISSCDTIPETIINKPPSAELRKGQKDVDTLPPYELLDPVIKAYVEEDRSVEQMINSGMDENIVRKAVRLIDHSEYKRRQAPPGIKITARAFGKDRRLPITNKFQGNSIKA